MNTRSIFAPTFNTSHYGIAFKTKPGDNPIGAIVVGDENNRFANIEAVYLGRGERWPLSSLENTHLVVEGIVIPPKHRGDSFRLIATDAATDAERMNAQNKCIVRINTHNPAKAEGDGWIEIPESEEAKVEIVARGNTITGVNGDISSNAEDYLLVMEVSATVMVFFEGIEKPFYFSPLCGLKLVPVEKLASENEQTTASEAPDAEPQPSVH